MLKVRMKYLIYRHNKKGSHEDCPLFVRELTYGEKNNDYSDDDDPEPKVVVPGVAATAAVVVIAGCCEGSVVAASHSLHLLSVRILC